VVERDGTSFDFCFYWVSVCPEFDLVAQFVGCVLVEVFYDYDVLVVVTVEPLRLL